MIILHIVSWSAQRRMPISGSTEQQRNTTERTLSITTEFGATGPTNKNNQPSPYRNSA